jgi:hypothetical protein
MSKHFIYHIFGKKVGVTQNVVRRMKEQNIKEGEYEVLEEYTNAKTASVRERELQIEKGYKVDKTPYWKTLKAAKKAQTPQAIAKRVANTDWKAKVANTDYKAIVAKIDYKARTTNIDYSKIDYKARAANTDYKAKAIKCEKSVLQFDKQGNFIKQWDSIKKASVVVNGFDGSIGNCLKGRVKSAGGYVWKYAN